MGPVLAKIIAALALHSNQPPPDLELLSFRMPNAYNRQEVIVGVHHLRMEAV